MMTDRDKINDGLFEIAKAIKYFANQITAPLILIGTAMSN